MTDESDQVDDQTDHASDAAELGKRDRAQPSLSTDRANLRPDGDAKPDKEERRAAIDSLTAAEGSLAEAQRREVEDDQDDQDDGDDAPGGE